MKKALIFCLPFVFSGLAFAQSGVQTKSVNGAVSRAVKRAFQAVCKTEKCFKEAVEKDNYRLVENTLKRYAGTELGADFIHMRFDVNGAQVLLPEYLVANGKISQARELFDYYYLHCSRFDYHSQEDDGVDNLLEKLVFAKGNPARMGFAKDLLNKYTTVAVSNRTLQYAVTQAKDADGYAYVELLLTKSVGGINTSQRDRLSYRTPYALGTHWNMRDVMSNEFKFEKNPEKIKWLKKTQQLLVKHNAY